MDEEAAADGRSKRKRHEGKEEHHGDGKKHRMSEYGARNKNHESQRRAERGRGDGEGRGRREEGEGKKGKELGNGEERGGKKVEERNKSDAGQSRGGREDREWREGRSGRKAEKASDKDQVRERRDGEGKSSRVVEEKEGEKRAMKSQRHDGEGRGRREDERFGEKDEEKVQVTVKEGDGRKYKDDRELRGEREDGETKGGVESEGKRDNNSEEKIGKGKVEEENAHDVERDWTKRKERDVEEPKEKKVTKRRRWDQDEEKKEDAGSDGSRQEAGVAGAAKVGGLMTNGTAGVVIVGPAPPALGSAPAIPVTLSSSGPSAAPPSATQTSASGQAAVKPPTLSLEALAKARKALQMQKELNAKLAKLPQLNKTSGATAASPANPLATPVPPAAASAPAPTRASGVASFPSPAQPMIGASPGVTGTSQVSTTTAATATATMQSGVNPQMASAFPGFMAGLIPGLMPGLLPGMVHGMLPSLDVMLKAQAMAQQLGFPQMPGMMQGMRPPIGSIGAAASTSEPKPAKPPVLRLDAQGREIDEAGNVVERSKQGPVSTLKVNINKAKKEAFKILRPELEEDPIDSPFYDPRMGSNKTRLIRARKPNLNFVQEGEMIKRAEIQRLRAQVGEARITEIRARQTALARAKAEQGKEENPNLIAVAERVPVVETKKPKEPIPDTEWWDVPILATGNYSADVEDGKVNVKNGKITIYVEHPIPIEPPAEAPPPPPQPLKLTKKEQKKLRTQRRLAREKERQEMIRQGLLEPPKPKVKMSNLMKVLGAEATQDPTRMEQQVKSAAAEREQAHADRNLARKLTPAERREKKERKLFDDPTTLETIVSVYRLVHLAHPQTRFKVDINVQENRMTGRCVMTDDMTLILVEGGSKSTKRFSKLMLRRINWSAAVIEEKEEDLKSVIGARPNSCKLVWQGATAKPSYENFRIEEFRTAAAARKYMEERGGGHYWDLACNFPTD